MKLILKVLALIVSISGCANQSFFYPSKSPLLHSNIQMMPSKSGNQIAYLWFESLQFEKKGFIVHFHGNHGHMEKTSEKVDWLTNHGFDVLVFDYSGFGVSQGSISDKAAYLDGISILDYITNINLDAQLPLFVIATSTGGNIFLRAINDNPIPLNGVILDSTFMSYAQVAEHVLSQSFLGLSYSWFAHVIMRDDYAAINAKPRSNNSWQTMQSLVIHCEHDDVVPIHFGKKVFNQLEGTKEFWPLRDCEHARGMTREFPENQNKIINWLENINIEQIKKT